MADRVQTQGIDQVPLQPIARPTNQFIAPEVRLGTGADKDVTALATSLGQFEPQLYHLASNIDTLQQETAKTDAAAIQEQRQFKNKSDLKAAAARGEIHDGNNPWLMVELKKSVVRTEAQRAYESIQDAYSKDPIQHSDNVADVEKWVDQQILPLTEGKDAWELKELAPIADDIRHRITGQYLSVRPQERMQEAAAGISGEVSSATAAFASHQTTQEQFTASIAKMATEKGTVIPWPKLNPMIAQAAEDAALAHRDPSLFRNILSAVKTPGGTVADTDQSKVAESEIRAKIMSMDAADYRQAEFAHKQMVKQQTDTLFSLALKKSGGDPTKFADVGFSYNDILADTSLDPDVRDGLLDAWTKVTNQTSANEQHVRTVKGYANEDKTNYLNEQMSNYIRRGKYTNPDFEVKIVSAYEAISQAGGENARQMIDALHSQGRERDDADKVKDFWIQVGKGEDVSIDDVIRDYKPYVTAPTFKNFVETIQAVKDKAGKSGNSTGPTASVVSSELPLIESRIIAGRMNSGPEPYEDAARWKQMDPHGFEAANLDAGIAQADFAREMHIATEAFQKKEGRQPSYSEASDIADKLGDSIVTRKGGWTREQMNQQFQKSKDKAAVDAQTASASVTVAKPSAGDLSIVRGVSKYEPTLEAATDQVIQGLSGIIHSGPKPPGAYDMDTTLDASVLRETSAPLHGFLKLMGDQATLNSPGMSSLYGAIHETLPYQEDMSAAQIKAWEGAQRVRQMFKQQVANVLPKSQKLIDDVAATSGSSGSLTATPKQRHAALFAASALVQLSAYTEALGITVHEASKLPPPPPGQPPVWKSIPMFANADHLRQGAVAAFSELGIKPPDQADFIREQSRLIQERYDRHAASTALSRLFE